MPLVKRRITMNATILGSNPLVGVVGVVVWGVVGVMIIVPAVKVLSDLSEEK